MPEQFCLVKQTFKNSLMVERLPSAISAPCTILGRWTGSPEDPPGAQRRQPQGGSVLRLWEPILRDRFEFLLPPAEL